MTYDEMSDKLRAVLAEAKRSGKAIESVAELQEYLDSKLARPKRRGARTLKGLSLG